MTAEFSALAIETSTEACSVAACAGDRISMREYASSQTGSRHIFELINEILDEIRQSLQSLDCVAFGCGPGGFTGLRVGAAVTQSLAFGASLSVVRASSLAVMAAGAIRKHDVSLVAPCLDARMGEAYLAVYRADEQDVVRVEFEDSLVDPQTFELDSRQNVYAVGPGWGAFPSLRERNAGQIADSDMELMPSARDLLTVARQRFQSGQTIRAEAALPNYIRDKVTQ
jgi:tRNA threonylcarbamoyladenosine biosynthesis protein TsaB